LKKRPIYSRRLITNCSRIPDIHELLTAIWVPDLIRLPWATDSIDIVELKLPQASLVAHRGNLVFQSGAVTSGVAQVRRYAEITVDPSYRSEIEALFGTPVNVSSRTLVLGMAHGIDPDKLSRIRSYIDDVDVIAWDEFFARAYSRYAN
jgi:hypothetical protein